MKKKKGAERSVFACKQTAAVAAAAATAAAGLYRPIDRDGLV